jgi:hypothetical protein
VLTGIVTVQIGLGTALGIDLGASGVKGITGALGAAEQ